MCIRDRLGADGALGALGVEGVDGAEGALGVLGLIGVDTGALGVGLETVVVVLSVVVDVS